VDSTASSGNAQLVELRRPSVDSIASTADSVPIGVPLNGLSFDTIGTIAAAAQKFKTFSRQGNDEVWHGKVECAYCFADLCQGPVVYLNDKVPDCQGCCHFLHAKCCSAIMKRARQETAGDMQKLPKCPKCQGTFEESHVLPLPNPLEDPEGWYKTLDVFGTDRLPRWKVLEALIATLPIEVKALRAAVWKKGQLRGKLTFAECKEVLDQLEMELPKNKRCQAPVPPDVEQVEDWFAYWDVGGVGMLTQEETTRALLKSFPNHELPILRAAIDVAWQEHARRNTDFSDMVGVEAFSDRNSGIVALALQKYKAAKYWKIWGADGRSVNHLPSCLSGLSDDA